MKLYSVFLPYSLIIKTNVGLNCNHKNILIYKNTQNIIYSIILKLNRCPQKDRSLKLQSNFLSQCKPLGTIILSIFYFRYPNGTGRHFPFNL